MDLVKKWEQMGIIPDDAKNKKNIVTALEIAQKIFQKNEKKFDETSENFKELIFPLISRLFALSEKDMSVDQIRDIVINIIKDFKKKLTSGDVFEKYKNVGESFNSFENVIVEFIFMKYRDVIKNK